MHTRITALGGCACEQTAGSCLKEEYSITHAQLLNQIIIISMNWNYILVSTNNYIVLNMFYKLLVNINSIIYSHNTVQLHSLHVSVTKYNVCIIDNNNEVQ